MSINPQLILYAYNAFSIVALSWQIKDEKISEIKLKV